MKQFVGSDITSHLPQMDRIPLMLQVLLIDSKQIHSCRTPSSIDMWRQGGKWSFSYSIFKFLSVHPCTHECSAIAAPRSLPGVLRITGSDIFPLCTVRRRAIIEYQVHKLLFNLTCVLEAINTCGAVGAA